MDAIKAKHLEMRESLDVAAELCIHFLVYICRHYDCSKLRHTCRAKHELTLRKGKWNRRTDRNVHTDSIGIMGDRHLLCGLYVKHPCEPPGSEKKNIIKALLFNLSIQIRGSV